MPYTEYDLATVVQAVAERLRTYNESFVSAVRRACNEKSVVFSKDLLRQVAERLGKRRYKPRKTRWDSRAVLRVRKPLSRLRIKELDEARRRRCRGLSDGQGFLF
ncbi:MAG: hypothetical protein HYS59_01505 [Candidatus Vogelbacteria bacterium]|nr:hypothetical protein [Candidatus Vogelbacteria bacterium]